MTTIGLFDPNLPSQIEFNLSRTGQEGKIAEKVGNKMYELEGQLMDKYSSLAKTTDEKEQKSIEAEIQGLDIQYKRANRMYETFMQLMKNMHETLMRAIQNLGVR